MENLTDKTKNTFTHPGAERLNDKELYKLCQEYGRNILMWRRKFVSLLPEVEKRQLYKRHGFYSIYEFAAKLGGLGHKTVEEVLRTYRRVENKPLLKKKIEKVGWGKIRAVASIADNVEEKDLVEMVENLPKQALEMAVKEIKEQKGKFATPPGWGQKMAATSQSASEKYTKMSFDIDEETEFRLRKFKQKLSKRCSYPHCNKPAEIIHHPDRFSLVQNHNNIKPLCKSHHQIAHSGFIKNEQKDPSKWKIQPYTNQNPQIQKIDKKYQQYSLKL